MKDVPILTDVRIPKINELSKCNIFIADHSKQNSCKLWLLGFSVPEVFYINIQTITM